MSVFYFCLTPCVCPGSKFGFLLPGPHSLTFLEGCALPQILWESCLWVPCARDFDRGLRRRQESRAGSACVVTTKTRKVAQREAAFRHVVKLRGSRRVTCERKIPRSCSRQCGETAAHLGKTKYGKGHQRSGASGLPANRAGESGAAMP